MVPAKEKSKNTVSFKVKLPFNGHSRGVIIKDVPKEKAAAWALRGRGVIVS